MEMYIITSSENMELVKFMTAAAGTILHFGIALIIWRTIWCTVRQLNTPTMKVVGLGGCWVSMDTRASRLASIKRGSAIYRK